MMERFPTCRRRLRKVREVCDAATAEASEAHKKASALQEKLAEADTLARQAKAHEDALQGSLKEAEHSRDLISEEVSILKAELALLEGILSRLVTVLPQLKLPSLEVHSGSFPGMLMKVLGKIGDQFTRLPGKMEK